ncbi:DUF4148 domain-containing protein [Allopusillimonas ginsengisoli]|nr:DUF4148 domain-containing protein [Allopusillimonas ginsengisoli]
MKATFNLILVMTAIAFGPQGAVQASGVQNSGLAVQVSSERELTRAEVLADLAMWKRAGLEEFWKGENTPDTFSREYREAYAEYTRMRSGPEYQEELQRRK